MALTGLTEVQFTNLNVTGVATFAQTVGIAGTLTYEDVKNVDSVGVITARDGIQVVGGGITCVGVATATNFKTGSSNLHSTGLTVGDSFVHNTGLNVGSNIKLGSAGVVTATAFKGDGAQLTGVSSAEVYGFTGIGSHLQVTTTNKGADDISGAQYSAFEQVIFAASGITFSINNDGKLIATI